MASIFGFSIKNIKTFRGREWDGIQGNIYYKGAKVGWYSDNGDGGCSDIEFDGTIDDRVRYELLLEQATNDYFDRFPLEGQFAQLTPSTDMFMGALCDLTFDEKLYKKYAKQGRPFVVTFEEGYHSKIAAGRDEKVFAMVDAMKDERKDVTDVCKYRSLQDFDIK